MKSIITILFILLPLTLNSQTKLGSPSFRNEVRLLNDEIINTLKEQPYKINISSNQIINIFQMKYEGQFAKSLFLNGLFLDNLTTVYIKKKKLFKNIKIISSGSLVLDNNGRPIKTCNGVNVFYCDSTDVDYKKIAQLYLEKKLDYCFWIEGTPLEVRICVGQSGVFIVKDGYIYDCKSYFERNWSEYADFKFQPPKEIKEK